MAMSRTRVIIGIVAAVVLLSLGYGALLAFGPSAKYRGLTTHIEVDMDDATRAYVENQLKTSQAALAAEKAKGDDIDLNLYAEIANSALVLGDLVPAREALEAEMKGNPLNYAAVNAYGNVLEKMGDYTGARTQFEKALAMSNGGAPESFYINEVDLLQAHFPKETDAVKAVLESSVTNQGQTSWNMVQLGRWYLAAGDCQRAIDHFNVAKTLAPKNQNIADELRSIQETCVAK